MKSLRWIIVLTILSMFTVPMPAGAFTGSATIQWVMPTTFADGTKLNPATDLKETRAYCGTVSGQYSATPTAVFAGGTTTSGTIDNLPVGTTYCVVRPVTTDALGGLEAANSNEASKTITAPASSGATGCTMN